jgi:hypothetical protein
MKINRGYYETPEPSSLKKLLWKAAGADKYILERSTYSDQIKYMCMGGIIVATGLMAGMAGGYAFYTIFAPKTASIVDKTKFVTGSEVPTDPQTLVLSILFGIIWGLIIFNIDRFIVTSTGKGDGTEAITKSEIKTALPRIFMGAIIALTISKPVEIRMFQGEIALKVQEQQDKEKQKGIDQAEINYQKKVKPIEDRIKPYDDDINALEKTSMDLRNEVQKEITGKNNNGAAYGPRAAELERQAVIIEQRIESIKSAPTYIQLCAEREAFKEQRRQEIAKVEKMAATYDGLLIRIKKAHELSPIISLFITLLFLAIELTPIFFKLMLIKGPYDYLEENIKELIKAEQGIEVQYNYYPSKKGVEKHLVLNHQVDKVLRENVELLKSQEEINKEAINKWKSNQHKKLENNLDEFISEDKS